MSKRKILVIGGGVGGVSAAWALSGSPNPPEIRLLQMGWRLGGKGASGRSSESVGRRIEEHGVHVWSGLYENAFRVLRQAYTETGRPADHPLATIDRAFYPHQHVVLMERWRDQWMPWEIDLPANELAPGVSDALFPNASIVVEQTIRWAAALVLGRSDWLGADVQLHERGSQRSSSVRRQLVDRFAQIFAPVVESPTVSSTVVTSLVRALEEAWPWFAARLDSTRVRRSWIVLNFAVANLRGMIQDDVIARGFDAIDDQDYLAWLARFAVRDGELMLGSPLARFVYDAEFAYVDGDLRRPNIAAGASLRTLIRMAVGWRGTLLWKMRGGMGDVVFAPLYLAMRRRGVKVDFFHRLESLHLSSDKSAVDAVRVGVQAVARDRYDPLQIVRGVECWPSEPDWSQLLPSEAVRARSNFEDPNTPAEEHITLRRGVDFDDVVLATPVATHPAVAAELINASAAWRSSVEHVKTVATQAVQLWFCCSDRELGWRGAARPLLGAFQESPLNTIVDMSHVLQWECWQSDRSPECVMYLCGPLPDTDDPDAAVRSYADDLFAGPIRWVWPGAVTDDGVFRHELLKTSSSVSGDALSQQYLRHNSWPSERFTMSVAGSTQHRLRPDRSGFSNLVVAGDWTRNGFNIGNVEAATMSGLLASNALTGYPKREDILGVDFGAPREATQR